MDALRIFANGLGPVFHADPRLAKPRVKLLL